MVHLFEPSEIRRLLDNSSSTLHQLAHVVECDLAVHSCLPQAVRSIDCRVPDGFAPNDNGPHMLRSFVEGGPHLAVSLATDIRHVLSLSLIHISEPTRRT